MFCNQCQETAKNEACTVRGVCGKEDNTANLQDLLVYVLSGVSLCYEELGKDVSREHGVFISKSIFATITNANFDNESLVKYIKEAFKDKR